MKKMWDLIIDGAFLALPVGLGGFLVYKLVGKLSVLIAPAKYLTPEAGWAKFIAVEMAALLVVIISLILLGLFSRSTFGQRFVRPITDVVKSKVPGYMILKSIAADVANQDEENEFRPAIIHFDNNIALGLIVEQSNDGMNYTVFMPSAPGAVSGIVRVFSRDRVEVLQVSTISALRVMKMRGIGLQALFKLPALE